MKSWKIGAVAALMFAGLAQPMAAAGADAPVSSWIVTLVDGSDASSDGPALAQRNGGRTGHIYEHVFEGFQFIGSEQAATNLARNPRVRSVVADGIVHAVEEVVPTGVSRINGPAAHAAGSRGQGAVVAVIDTGIDLDHPDLEANIHGSLGKTCVGGTTSADDDNGHGTHVAGTIAAVDNTAGVIGVAPDTKLVPVKVLSSSGSGTWTDVICGIDFVTGNSNGIDVANLSLGGSGKATGCTDGGLHQAVCNAVDKGVTVVVAAGNDSQDASGFVPASYPEAITVSAFSDTDGAGGSGGCTGRGPWKTCDEVFASFSNYGSIVDIMAPGVSINSTVIDGGYGSKSGTSMAAPHVAGVAALAIAAGKATTPAGVVALLRATGECPDGIQATESGSCSGKWSGDSDGIAEPMVNAARAVGATSSGDTTNDTTDPTISIELNVTGYKVKGVQRADLTWSGATTVKVDVYRDGSLVTNTANDGTFTDNIGNKGGGSYTYKLCEATTTCSNEVTVTF